VSDVALDEHRRLLDAERHARAIAEDARERASFLVHASEVLVTSHDYASAIATVARLAAARVADACIIDFVVDGNTRRVVAARDDVRRDAVSLLPERLGLTAQPQASQVCLEGEQLGRAGFSSLVAAPMTLRGRAVGSLLFASSSPQRRYGAEDLAMITELARHVRLAVENARLFRETQAALAHQRRCLDELEQERAHLEVLRREAETANRMKDEFLATVSHELRAPLAALLMWEHVLRSDGADDALRARALEAIRVSARLQSRLIEDLLDVSRAISGKLHIDRQPVRLQDIVTDGAETLREDADAKGVTVQITLDPAADKVNGDAARLTQVVGNLLSNAVKFSPKGAHVRVAVEAAGEHVRLVGHEGEGIEPEFLPRIFDAFSQADGTSTRAHGGLGLGLAVVKHLIEMHGGTVRATSGGKNAGATFTVELPAFGQPVVTHPGLRRLADLEGFDKRQALAGIEVVVVDDEDDVRDGLVAVLEGAGARVTACACAQDAVDAVRRRVPDVVLSDVAMPGEDGYSLIERLRAMEVGGRRTRAVAVTARATAADRQRALAAGFAAHLAKPFEPPELISLVALLAATPKVGLVVAADEGSKGAVQSGGPSGAGL
jgi:signal transduction histidine kinase/CheY-like chemotaxis protein